jgi:hypothetical protein
MGEDLFIFAVTKARGQLEEHKESEKSKVRALEAVTRRLMKTGTEDISARVHACQ